MPWRRLPDRPCRWHEPARHLTMPAWPARARRKRDGLRIAVSLNLRRGGVGRALVVDPAYFQIVALLAALEGELDIGVLGDAAAPVGHEHRLAVIFEGQLLDEVRRDDLALGVLDEAGIHRVLDQGLHFGGLAGRCGAHANGRCHLVIPYSFSLRMI